jgi:protein-disulfide isomerase
LLTGPASFAKTSPKSPFSLRKTGIRLWSPGTMFFTPRRAFIALFAAATLAACGQQGASDGFKPVPVNPVLGDVPQGSATAPVTVLEYASYTCSHCRDFWKQEFPRLKAEYIDTGKVKFIYRDFPLDENLAVTLAAIARCKGQDAYFKVIDDLFTDQYEILNAAQQGQAAPLILGIAERNGMSQDEVRTCIDHHPELKKAIIDSRNEGSARGVNSTPAVFVNDVRVEASGYDALKAAIEKALNPNATTEAPAEGATPPAPAEGAPASAPGQ